MNCGITDTEWTGYLDQALSPSDRRRLDSHLRHCAPCRCEIDALRQVDQQLRIECGLLLQSVHPAPESMAAGQQRILAALRQTTPKNTNERLWRVRWVLALLCGANTATRIIQAAESHADAGADCKPAEQKWLLFLRRLSYLTTEICGCSAGELILVIGK